MGELCEITSSKRIFAKEYCDKGIPFYRGKEIIQKAKGEDILTELYISVQRFSEIEKRFGAPQKGDILLTAVGTLGVPYLVGDEKFYFKDGNLVWLRNFNNVLPEFVYYWLKSPGGQNAVKLHTIGSTQQALTIDALKKFKIMLPKADQQRRIVSVISSLEKKLSINKKINANLQQQSQAIFKSWFVDFEPFQDGEFVESELGPIPKGWRVGSVADIVNLHDSKRIPLSGAQRQRMEKKIYPYYGAASLMDYVENYIFDGIYLLLGEDGTVMDDKGYPILQYVWGKFWVNNHAHVLTGKCGYSVESLYLLFLNTPVKSIVTGAVQAKISQSNLKAIQIIVPPQEVLDRFNELIQPYFSMIRQKGEENKRLENLRDTLLPKLMNGEIDIIKD